MLVKILMLCCEPFHSALENPMYNALLAYKSLNHPST